MSLLDQEIRESHVLPLIREADLLGDERAARQSLRAQISRLERELGAAFVTAYPMGGLDQAPAGGVADPRLLDLGELEQVRDELAERLRRARVTIAERVAVGGCP